MGLADALAQKQQSIVKQWFQRVSDTYPPDTSQFLRSRQDPFANPVGQSLRSGLKVLVEEICGAMHAETIRKHLDPIIRIRAVQNFTPTEATGFIQLLKPIVRDALTAELRQGSQYKSLLELEDRIDTIQLTAFDIYMQCREKIYDLKANVERSTVYSAFRRAGLVDDEPEASDTPENHQIPSI
ncbi:MAG: RsbRD N-terminal domain-containing protein [Desulfobacterales bacterium]